MIQWCSYVGPVPLCDSIHYMCSGSEYQGDLGVLTPEQCLAAAQQKGLISPTILPALSTILYSTSPTILPSYHPTIPMLCHPLVNMLSSHRTIAHHFTILLPYHPPPHWSTLSSSHQFTVTYHPFTYYRTIIMPLQCMPQKLGAE